MDPTDINKHTDLVAALNRLRGTRSYSDLSKAAAALRPRDGRHPDLPTSTISDLLNAKSMPSVDTVVTFLAACGVDVGDAQRPWLDAMARVATEHQRRPSGVVRVREARPRLLGVHAAIQVDRQFTEHGQARASDELPPYVPRDLDTDLRTKLADARHRGDFVLLVGGSSVGKSRTLFEAVTSALTDWWLFHPADTDAVRKFATAPTAQTVVWLDELQNYLNAPDSLPAATIRDLLKAGVIVVATLWPGEYATRTTPRTSGPPDPYANDRDLLGIANVVTVADTFSDQELRQAEHLAKFDGRIRVALDTPDAGFTQVMAAGPELVRWWEQAPTDHCYGKAIITAALDARRVGIHAPLTRDYLEAAAPGYLSPTDIARAHPGWLDHALTYATERLHGATATLSPVSARLGHTDGYEVADYLHQHALRVRRTIHLPDSTWRALVDHHHANDTRRLADNARRRGRDQEAETLYRRLVYDHGDRAALLELAGLLTKAGRGDDAITLLWGGAEAGNGNVVLELVRILAEQGKVDEAIRLLRERVEAGDRNAIRQLTSLLITHSRVDDAIEALRDHGQADDSDLADQLASLLAEQGRVEELTRRADNGDERSLFWLAHLLAEQGHADEAIAVLRPHVGTVDQDTTWLLVRLLDEKGHVDEAIGILRDRADDGDLSAAVRMADLLAEHGRVEEAITVLRGCTRDGDARAAFRLARLLASHGWVDEVIARLRRRSDAPQGEIVFFLADLLAEHGRVDEAVAVLRERAGTGDDYAGFRLATVLAHLGQVDEALVLLRTSADAGNWFAGESLIDRLVQLGRIDELAGEVAAGTPGAVDAYRAAIR